MGKKIKDVKKAHTDFKNHLRKLSQASNNLDSALNNTSNPNADLDSEPGVRAACDSLDAQVKDLTANVIMLLYAGC